MITAAQRAKFIWNCRRGMLELDVLLNRFITQHIDNLSAEEFSLLEPLLRASDPDLFAWLMDIELPQDKELLEGVRLIQLHTAL